MKKYENQIIWGLRIFLAVLFLFSAYAKLYPKPYFAITTFEIKQLVQQLGFSDFLAPYFSRFIIGAEIALGLGFLQPHFLRKLVLPLSALLLVIFNAHLAHSIYTNVGGNCGCFGELLPMSPTQAFIKNVLTLGLIFWLWKLIKARDAAFKHNFFAALSLALASILFMFVLVPIQPKKIVDNNPSEQELGPSNVVIFDDTLDTNSVTVENPSNPKDEPTTQGTQQTNTQQNTPIEKPYEPEKVKSGFAKYAPKIDEGKKLLLFFAPGCDHCQEAAVELVKMSKEIKDFPKMFILFMDEEPEKIPAFLEKAGKKISYSVLDIGTFWSVIGQRDTPGVLYLWNGNQVIFMDGIDQNAFTSSKLKTALNKKKL